MVGGGFGLPSAGDAAWHLDLELDGEAEEAMEAVEGDVRHVAHVRRPPDLHLPHRRRRRRRVVPLRHPLQQRRQDRHHPRHRLRHLPRPHRSLATRRKATSRAVSEREEGDEMVVVVIKGGKTRGKR